MRARSRMTRSVSASSVFEVRRIEPPGALGAGMSINCPGPAGRSLNGTSSLSSAVLVKGPATGGDVFSISSPSTESPSSKIPRARDSAGPVMESNSPT